MARGRRRRSSPKQRRMGPSHNEMNRDTKASRQRQRLLDLSNESIFRYDMEDILAESSCPEESRPAFVATVWSKAARLGIPEAQTFIKDKTKEGVIDADTEKKLLRLLDRNAVYR